MSRLTRGGTAEPVSRDEIIWREHRQGKFCFPVLLTPSRMGSLTRLIHTLLYVLTTHVDQLGSAVNPACGQLNVVDFSCPRLRLRTCSPETGSAVLTRVSLVLLHTRAESDARYKNHQSASTPFAARGMYACMHVCTWYVFIEMHI